MNKTGIEWTDWSWNPIHAKRKNGGKTGNFCTRISPGCVNCYASKINQRWGNGLEYIVPNLANVEFYLDEKELAAPIKLKKPSRIFVGDMFDLFHEAIPIPYIAEVLRVAMKTPRHTFQFLTKRAKRMRVLVTNAQEHWGVTFPAHMHFGVSVEDQPRADQRIPELLQTRASVRWLSVEPMLEAINIEELPSASGIGRYLNCLSNAGVDAGAEIPSRIDWIVCGGESGPGARPFNLAWAESILEQCRAAGVPFFMKQVGSRPVATCKDPRLPDVEMNGTKGPDAKGGDPQYWPESLRVREFPAERSVTA